MKKRLKGFTLMELIIVIAIIGVLMGVLIPSWMNYISSSRLKAQNNNAKTVFNASQTVMQQYSFKERFSTEADSKKVTDGTFYLYWDGSTATATDGSNAKDAALSKAVAESINKIFSGSNDTCYRIYVSNYIVKSVVSGRQDDDTYLGTYPISQDDASAAGSRVSTYDMDSIDLP